MGATDGAGRSNPKGLTQLLGKVPEAQREHFESLKEHSESIFAQQEGRIE